MAKEIMVIKITITILLLIVISKFPKAFRNSPMDLSSSEFRSTLRISRKNEAVGTNAGVIVQYFFCVQI